MTLRRTLVTAFALVLLVPGLAPAAGVQARFDLSSPAEGPFPSDVFTVADPSQNTGLRVKLPKPAACPAVVPPPPALLAVPTDCFDIDELNTLDGFNVQPRLRVPFTGAIDPDTVAGNVFVVRLGGGEARVEVNQVVWDAATTTLFAESDQLLDQHTRYALIVTDGVRDATGDPVEAGAFASFRHDLNFGQTKSAALKAYRKALLEALAAAGVNPRSSSPPASSRPRARRRCSRRSATRSRRARRRRRPSSAAPSRACPR
jgi:Bacterial Ig-like domain